MGTQRWTRIYLLLSHSILLLFTTTPLNHQLPCQLPTPTANLRCQAFYAIHGMAISTRVMCSCLTQMGQGRYVEPAVQSPPGTYYTRTDSAQIGSSAEASLWIAQPLRWKVVESHETPAEAPVTLIDNVFSSQRLVPELVATIEIQIIAEKAPLWIYSSAPTNVYPDNLLDSAFVANKYRITVERGEFWAPRNGRPKSNIPESMFGLQMTMDKSPYPQIDTWKPDMKDMLEQMRPFDKCCFVAQRLEGKQFQG